LNLGFLNTKRDAHKTFDTGYSAWARSVLFFIFFKKKSYISYISMSPKNTTVIFIACQSRRSIGLFKDAWLMVPFSPKRMSLKSHGVSTKKKNWSASGVIRWLMRESIQKTKLAISIIDVTPSPSTLANVFDSVRHFDLETHAAWTFSLTG